MERPLEERIRFIEHEGKRILFIDLSNCSADEVTTIARVVPSYVTSEPRGSVLLLADFTGAQFDRIAIDRLKEGTVFDRPHVKKSAWVGVESIPHVFFEHIKSFSRRELPAFKTLEEARAWLVAEDKTG